MIFGAYESWNSTLYKSKVFTPLTGFLHSFCFLKTNRVKIVKSGNFDLFRMFICQSGGKKLVSGVKNFRYAKLDYSAFICTKKFGKISKIGEIGWKSNFDILAITAKSAIFWPNMSDFVVIAKMSEFHVKPISRFLEIFPRFLVHMKAK